MLETFAMPPDRKEFESHYVTMISNFSGIGHHSYFSYRKTNVAIKSSSVKHINGCSSIIWNVTSICICSIETH